MNDPAAVVYDPKHGVYHDHWEDHLARPGGGYSNGHAVSRDFTHWAHVSASPAPRWDQTAAAIASARQEGDKKHDVVWRGVVWRGVAWRVVACRGAVMRWVFGGSVFFG